MSKNAMNETEAAEIETGKAEAGKAGEWRAVTLTEFLDLKPGEEELIDFQLDLSEAVKARRKQLKVTQAELAQRLGTTQPYVANMENAGASTDLLLRAMFVLGESRAEIAKVIADGAVPDGAVPDGAVPDGAVPVTNAARCALFASGTRKTARGQKTRRERKKQLV